MDLVVKNGTVVTAADAYPADVGIKDGVIVAIGRGLDGEGVIEAEGKY